MEARIEVWFGEGLPEEDMRAVRDVLASEGIEAESRSYPPLPVGDGMGFYVILVLAQGTLGQFFTGYFGAAGKDAWEGTKRLVLKLRDQFHELHKENIRVSKVPREMIDTELELIERESGSRVFLRASYPDEAFRQVLDLEFKPDTWYVWEDGQWVERQPGELGFTPDPEEWERRRNRYLTRPARPEPPVKRSLWDRIRRRPPG